MTFHAILTADHICRHFGNFTLAKLFMQFFVGFVKRITGKLYFFGPVALQAPAHAKVIDLGNFVHGLNWSVAFCAIEPA